MRRCVILEAVERTPTVHEANAQLMLGDEVISTASASEAAVEGPASTSARGVDRNEAVVYGWPTVVYDDDGEARAAPLWTVTCSPHERDADKLVIRLEAEFDINPVFADGSRFNPDLVDSVENSLADRTIPLAEIRSAIVKFASESLGLPLVGFESQHLLETISEAPGIYNAALLSRGGPVFTRRLIEELEAMGKRSDWVTTPAGALVTRDVSPAEKPDGSRSIAAPLSVNRSQHQVIVDSLSRPVTVATGPPGTGKSQVVVDLVANAWLRGESVLVVSTNNAAVDVAAERADEIVRGLLMRTGNTDRKLALGPLVSAAVEASAPLPHAERARLESDLNAASRSYDVFMNSIEQLRLLHVRQTEEVIQEETLGSDLFGVLTPPIAEEALRPLQSRLRTLAKAKFFVQWRIRRATKEFGVPLTRDSLERVATWAELRERIASRLTGITALIEELGDEDSKFESLRDQWVQSSRELTNRIVRGKINQGRASLQDLARASSTGANLTRAFKEALPILRAWACTNLSLASNFPLEPGLFDVVIVDEASQCLTAHVLPAAFRAKQLLIVGDAMQLPPIAKISNEQELAVLRSVGLDPSETEGRRLRFRSSAGQETFSSFDAYANLVGSDIRLLDEHYRCHPEIARWFNKTFYSGGLHVLTVLEEGDSRERGLIWVDVDGHAERAGSSSWHNLEEAREVARIVAAQLGGGRSVGVVTVFSGQEAAIRARVAAMVPREVLRESDFRIGTAHTFQGDERDVMIFSLCVAPGMSIGSAKWIEKERRLINVAVSRARKLLYVVGSPHLDDFPCHTLKELRSYVSANERNEGHVDTQIASESERRLYEALVDLDISPLSKLNLEGYELDFAIFEGADKFDVEVDGDQHIDDETGRLRVHDIMRDRAIRAAGWKVIRVPAWLCFTKPDVAAMQVLDLVRALTDHVSA